MWPPETRAKIDSLRAKTCFIFFVPKEGLCFVSYPLQGINLLPPFILSELDLRLFSQHVDRPEERHAIAGAQIISQACLCFPVDRKKEYLSIFHVPVDPEVPASFVVTNRWEEFLQCLIKLMKPSRFSFNLDGEFYKCPSLSS